MAFLRVTKANFQAFFMLKAPVFPGAMRFLELFGKTKVLRDAEIHFEALPVIFVPVKALQAKQTRPESLPDFLLPFQRFP